MNLALFVSAVKASQTNQRSSFKDSVSFSISIANNFLEGRVKVGEEGRAWRYHNDSSLFVFYLFLLFLSLIIPSVLTEAHKHNISQCPADNVDQGPAGGGRSHLCSHLRQAAQPLCSNDPSSEIKTFLWGNYNSAGGSWAVAFTVIGSVISGHTLFVLSSSKPLRQNPTMILILVILLINLFFTAIVLPLNSVAMLQ